MTNPKQLTPDQVSHVPKTVERRIVCAALQNETGFIICGPRHFDGIMHSQINMRSDGSTWKGSKQGFVDQRGNFLTREEALIVAVDADQLIRRCGGDGAQLFSENLY